MHIDPRRLDRTRRSPTWKDEIRALARIIGTSLLAAAIGLVLVALA